MATTIELSMKDCVNASLNEGNEENQDSKAAHLSELDDAIAFASLAPDRQSTLTRYFATLNAGDFRQTAALFAVNGALIPPFEEPVVGREAIADYLWREAQGMQLFPHTSVEEGLDNGDYRIHVRGRVQTPLLGVNVAWIFILNPEHEILLVRVNLLATLEELLPWRK